MAINLGTGHARFGADLGSALSTGLDMLANKKLQGIQEQHLRKEKSEKQQSLADMFKSLNYDEPTSNLLSYLGIEQPKVLGQLLPHLGGGQQFEQMGMGEVPQQVQGLQALGQNIGHEQAAAPGFNRQPQQYSQQQPKPIGFREALSQNQQKPVSDAELKHLDAITEQKSNLEDLISTTDRMLKEVQKGKLSTGVIASHVGQFAPSWLGESTEQFDKDAAHIVNLTSANIKGVPSRFRVQLIEKEKPGTKHSLPVNKQIITRLNEDARKKLGIIDQRYPQLSQFGSEEPTPKSASSNQQLFNELPNPAEFKGKKIKDKDTGKILQSNGSEWVGV